MSQSSPLRYSRHLSGTSSYDDGAASEAAGPDVGRPDRSPVTIPSRDSPRQEQEQGLRVHKRRNAGGFLLPSALRQSSDGKRRRVESKGKERARAERPVSLQAPLPQHQGRLSGSGLRSSPLAHGISSSNRHFESGLRAPSPTVISGRQSSEAGISIDGASSDYGRHSRDEEVFDRVPHSNIDPAQIVNMALNLSESRRRNVSASHILQQQGSGARRPISTIITNPVLPLGSSPISPPGGHLRQFLNQQRRISRTQSPGSPGAAGVRLSGQLIPETAGIQPAVDFPYNFSQSTLARAEKARQHIELSVEYRRLLSYLPPLEPDAQAPGNSKLSFSSVPGTKTADNNRNLNHLDEPMHDLGRQYNPLQLIRDRKLRARTRNTLKPNIEDWENIDVVRKWIDEVKDTSSRTGYRVKDRVRLPLLPHVGETANELGMFTQGQTQLDGGTKSKRQRIEWSFSPAEQLADAYWLEQNGNKYLIEDRYGNRIFPVPYSHSAQGRPSYESKRSLPASLGTSHGSFEHSDLPEDLIKDGTRGRRPPLQRGQRDESRGRFRHAWEKARHRSPSPSFSMSSSENGIKANGKNHRRIGSHEENTGPLQRQMERMLEAEGLPRSPDVETPEGSNRLGLTPDESDPAMGGISRTGTDSSRLLPNIDERDYGEELEPAKKRRAQERMPTTKASAAHSHSSFDEASSAEPSSPIVTPYIPGMDFDFSPGASRAASPRRSKKPLIPFMRGEALLGQRYGVSADQSDDQGSRQGSAEITSAPRSSLELNLSPSRNRRLFRHRTLDSSNEAQYGDDSVEREMKEPESAVKRFFKGRFGDIVRGDNLRKQRDSSHDDRPGDDQLTDSEVLATSDNRRPDPSLTSQVSRSTPHRTVSAEQLFHIDNLPSFKSSKGMLTPGPDHISVQKIALHRNRSPKLDSLAPPGLDMSRITTSSSNYADLSPSTTAAGTSLQGTRRKVAESPTTFERPRTRSRIGKRLQSVFDVPRGGGRGGLPATGLIEFSDERPPRRPNMRDKRHWSISDAPPARSLSRDPSAPQVIDLVMASRVKALLMCSGIKASEIVRRAEEIRESPPEFLLQAAQITGAEFRPVKRSEEHALAAQMLCSHLERETNQLHSDADAFLQKTVRRLRSRLEEMKDLVDISIRKAQDLGDDCVGFGSEVTGSRSLQVRLLADQLDKLARSRRRRMRWLRRAGFGLGEWAVTFLLWGIWLVVVIVKSILGIFKGVARSVRWILWI